VGEAGIAAWPDWYIPADGGGSRNWELMAATIVTDCAGWKVIRDDGRRTRRWISWRGRGEREGRYRSAGRKRHARLSYSLSRLATVRKSANASSYNGKPGLRRSQGSRSAFSIGFRLRRTRRWLGLRLDESTDGTVINLDAVALRRTDRGPATVLPAECC